jgi:hypothetical protein
VIRVCPPLASGSASLSRPGHLVEDDAPLPAHEAEHLEPLDMGSVSPTRSSSCPTAWC